jgi:hypothetical protein
MAKKKVEIDKPKIKARIKELKLDRDRALEARNAKELKTARRKIRRLKHELRAHTA